MQHGYPMVVGGPPMAAWRCQQCGFQGVPGYTSRVSTAGWIVFTLLAIFTCFLFCWVGLLIREKYNVCRNCSAKYPIV